MVEGCSFLRSAVAQQGPVVCLVPRSNRVVEMASPSAVHPLHEFLLKSYRYQMISEAIRKGLYRADFSRILCGFILSDFGRPVM